MVPRSCRELLQQEDECGSGLRPVGEEERRGCLRRVAVRLVSYVRLDSIWLALGRRPPRREGWGLAGRAEPGPPFMCC